jgi:VCBS repeat-containing protein
VTGGALQQNDVIYLPHINFDAAADSYDANTDVLTVGDGHGHTVTIDIVGGLAPGHSFSFESYNGGTLVQDPADSISAGGVVTLADTQAASAETVGFTAGNNGSQYIGAFSLGAVTNGNAGASVDWQFSLDDDQINLAPGQTVTQSYDVTAAAGQNGAASQTVSISIGGPGNDNFVFAPGVGADTIVNFNPQADTIELNHFANVQNQQQLAEAITTDASGDAVIELGHGDSITIPGVSTSYMQQHLQSLVHLH